MKMMFQYLRSHRKSVALFSVCAAILTVLYILFDVNIRLIAYGWLVCSAVGLVLSVGDFFKYKDMRACGIWRMRPWIPSITCRSRRI